MCYSSVDGISHLNPFICQECGFEFPESHESVYASVCINCEKEIVKPLSSWSLKPTVPRFHRPAASLDVEVPF